MAKRKGTRVAKKKSAAGKRKKKATKKAAKARAARKPTRRAPPNRADARRGAVAADAGSGGGGFVNVDLEKASGSPDFVRVTNAGRVVLAPGDDEGSIERVAVGSSVSLWIEVTGNPGATATIKVTRGSPNPIKVTIPSNTGQTAESQSVLVTG